MQANAYSPYVLRDLHQAIDLMDRKITYCTTFEAFETQDARDACLRKLSTKRAALVKTALALAALGVSCDPKFLPRSFSRVAEGEAGSVVAGPILDEGAKTTKLRRPRGKRS